MCNYRKRISLLLTFSWNCHRQVLVLSIIINLKCIFIDWKKINFRKSSRPTEYDSAHFNLHLISSRNYRVLTYINARSADRIRNVFHTCAHLPLWDAACSTSGIRRFSDSFQAEAQWQTPTRDGACVLGKSFLEHEISFPRDTVWQTVADVSCYLLIKCLHPKNHKSHLKHPPASAPPSFPPVMHGALAPNANARPE